MAVKTTWVKSMTKVEWNFILMVLKRLGFHPKWSNWLMQCIQSVSYSFLANDAVYGCVKPYRGIRQGDLLSPYILILCGEVLSGLCKQAARDGTLQGVRVARDSPRVNHLLSADDTMLFCRSDQIRSCSTLLSILQEYESASGQKINAQMSSITFSSKTPSDIKETAKQILCIQKEGGNGKYLGLPKHFGRRKRTFLLS